MAFVGISPTIPSESISSFLEFLGFVIIIRSPTLKVTVYSPLDKPVNL